jgi:hypothetical protein
MRQTSFGHIRETKGTGREKYSTEKDLRVVQNTHPGQELRILPLIKGGE